MKKELKSGILSADKLADHRPINRPTVGGVNVIAVLGANLGSLLYGDVSVMVCNNQKYQCL